MPRSGDGTQLWWSGGGRQRGRVSWERLCVAWCGGWWLGPACVGGRRLRKPAARKSGRMLCNVFNFSATKCVSGLDGVRVGVLMAGVRGL